MGGERTDRPQTEQWWQRSGFHLRQRLHHRAPSGRGDDGPDALRMADDGGRSAKGCQPWGTYTHPKPNSAQEPSRHGRIRGCHATSALGLSSPVLCPPQPVPQAPYYTLVHLGGAGLLTATGVGSTCRGGTRSRGWHVWGAYGARVREHAGEITP